MKAKAIANDAFSVLHGNRGRKPANATDPAIVSRLISIYQTDLPGYNFSHTTDILAEEKNIALSVSSVSRYLKAANLQSPKAKRRPKRHRSRNPRPREGELVQMDASSFDWLGTGSYLHLHGAIDDATGKVLALHFDKEETSSAYCELMFKMNADGHLPSEIYTDGRTVFTYDSKTKKHLSVADELSGKTERIPQFARALKEIGIRLIIAKSPQAKGAIERLWETLQDRLAKDLQRHHVSSVEQANAFLQSYIDYFNNKFAVQPLDPVPAYLPSLDTDAIHILFAKHETRLLNNGLSFSFKNNKYTLPRFYQNTPVAASPHDSITVVTSNYVGIVVLYKNLVLLPDLIHTPKKTCDSPAVLPPKKVHLSSRDNNRSPWFNYNNFFYSHKPRGDTFPD